MICVKCDKLMVEHQTIEKNVGRITWVCIKCEARVSNV